MTIAVNDADLRDILRAATADTDLNLIFEPGLDTRVQGLNLKGSGPGGDPGPHPAAPGHAHPDGPQPVHPEERRQPALLPRRPPRHGRAAAARPSRSTPPANRAAGNSGGAGTAGTPGPAGGGAYSTSYTSSVELESTSDPWGEVENGLMLLVFGRTVERQAAPAAAGSAPSSGAAASATAPRGYASGGRTLLIQPGSGLVR